MDIVLEQAIAVLRERIEADTTARSDKYRLRMHRLMARRFEILADAATCYGRWALANAQREPERALAFCDEARQFQVLAHENRQLALVGAQIIRDRKARKAARRVARQESAIRIED